MHKRDLNIVHVPEKIMKVSLIHRNFDSSVNKAKLDYIKNRFVFEIKLTRKREINKFSFALTFVYRL